MAILAFVSSLSAALAGMLVAVQMTLFDYVLAARFCHDSKEASCNPYDNSLVIRLLNAEIALLWDLCTRRTSLLVKNKTPRKQPQALRIRLGVCLASVICR